MSPNDRRLGFRVPLEMFLNEYVQDRAHRALTVNISETGVYLNKVLSPISRSNRVVGLEFELPGTGETIWARGEICYDSLDDYFHGQGVRFTGMPRLHARMLRDYCIEKRRAQLGDLLDRIRRAKVH
jgi:hypothetical protein